MTPPVRPKLLLTGGALAALLVAAAPAVAGNGGFAPVPPESPNAQDITDTWWFISIFILAIFVLVEGLLIAFVIRYRRRRPRDVDGPQIHGSTRLETMWTVAPVFVLFAIAAVVFLKLPGIRDVPSATASGETLEVEVVGHQFYWEFEYPNGVVAVNRLRAPVGVPVELTVTAPEIDVIHSWWIPALGGKIDAIPGVVNETWFQAKRTGVFRGQCAELCGIQHAVMLAEVEVLPAAEFDAWLAEQETAQADGTSELGEETYAGACATCHGLDGQGDVAANAPRLAGSALVGDPDAVEEIVRNGRGRMPAVGAGWSERQMDAVNDYLEETFDRGG
jgi:cytochrome c oxidase subunit 2